jgi:hypothetical protein
MKLEIKFTIETNTTPLAKAIQEQLKKYPKAEIRPIRSTRTEAQNRALHLFFTQLADELNEKGFDMRTLIRQEVEISWTPYSIKEYLWKPLQKALTGKKSTTQLDKYQEINLIYDNLNRIIIDRTQGEVTPPSFHCIVESIEDQTSYSR